MHFNEYIDSQKDRFLADLSRLVAVRSVREDAKDGAPFGDGPKKALDEAMAICAEHGFTMTNYDYYAGETDLGNDPALMILALTFFLQYPEEIVENFGVLGLSVTLLILLAMLCGAGLSRIAALNQATRRTIVIEVGMQNAAQAIMLAGVVFHSGEMALPAIMYALMMNVILLTYIYIIRKKTE
jgi:hypothetical protein